MKLQAILGAGAIALALMGSTALTMPAFAAQVPDGTKLADDQTFNYRVLDNINSVDPDIVEDVDTSYVVENLFEGLVNEDRKQPQPHWCEVHQRKRSRQDADHRTRREGDRRQDARGRPQQAGAVLRAHAHSCHSVPGAAGGGREVRPGLDQAREHRQLRCLYAGRELAGRARVAEAQPEVLG